MEKIKLHIWIPYDNDYIEIFDDDGDTNYLSGRIWNKKELKEEIAYLKNEGVYDIENLEKEIKKKLKEVLNDKQIKSNFRMDN